MDLLGDGRADRVRQPPAALGEPGDELVGSASGVGADQGPASAPVLLRQLGQGELGGGDVVGGGVAARIARPEQGRPPAPRTRRFRGRRRPSEDGVRRSSSRSRWRPASRSEPARAPVQVHDHLPRGIRRRSTGRLPHVLGPAFCSRPRWPRPPARTAAAAPAPRPPAPHARPPISVSGVVSDSASWSSRSGGSRTTRHPSAIAGSPRRLRRGRNRKHPPTTRRMIYAPDSRPPPDEHEHPHPPPTPAPLTSLDSLERQLTHQQQAGARGARVAKRWSEGQGMSSTFPAVLRACRSSWACRASVSG